MVRTYDSDSCNPGSIPGGTNAFLAQWLERLLYTQKVVSSILTESTILLAQLVERSAFNRNVVGSTPTEGMP